MLMLPHAKAQPPAQPKGQAKDEAKAQAMLTNITSIEFECLKDHHAHVTIRSNSHLDYKLYMPSPTYLDVAIQNATIPHKLNRLFLDPHFFACNPSFIEPQSRESPTPVAHLFIHTKTPAHPQETRDENTLVLDFDPPQALESSTP